MPNLPETSSNIGREKQLFCWAFLLVIDFTPPLKCKDNTGGRCGAFRVKSMLEVCHLVRPKPKADIYSRKTTIATGFFMGKKQKQESLRKYWKVDRSILEKRLICVLPQNVQSKFKLVLYLCCPTIVFIAFPGFYFGKYGLLVTFWRGVLLLQLRRAEMSACSNRCWHWHWRLALSSPL